MCLKPTRVCVCVFIGKVTEEHEVDGKTPVENYEDNESVKDLGETADLLNLVSTKKNVLPLSFTSFRPKSE